MQKTVRAFLILVLLLNVAAAVVLTGAVPTTFAVGQNGAEETSSEPEPSREALRRLGEELAVRAADLERREAQLEELLRSEDVLRLTALLVDHDTDPAPVPETLPGQPVVAPVKNEAFEKLQRAYENMEPESASLALAKLAAIDREAAVQLLTAWKPRTSGAILDALTQADPGLAAELSYEMWRRGGKTTAPAASSGR